MKYFFILVFLLIFLFTPSYGQESKNPSLSLNIKEISYEDFNRVARDIEKIELEKTHDLSWQVTLSNKLMYANPNGNAVIRFYDATLPDKFIEVGMGSPPDEKFWIAGNVPEEGYVVVHNRLERGWIPGANIIVSYTDIAGLTVNNGERIVVSNLDIGNFDINSYSVHGMESSTDPPAVNSGSMIIELLSGDPAQNVFHLFPFYITAVVGIIAAILFFTKKRSS